jgi:hypothetical protein
VDGGGARVYRLRRPHPAASVVATSFYVEEGPLRAWVRKGVHLWTLAPPDGDPDRLLADPNTRLVKDQRKVTVGVARVREVPATMPRESAATTTRAGLPGEIYIKRYNMGSWAMRLRSVIGRSPAFRAWDATRMLAAAGFRTAVPLAAVEYRRWRVLRKSFWLTAPVTAGVGADQYWWRLHRAPRGDRRRFVAGLAHLFASLHAAGVYHSDLKDANVLVRTGTSGELEFFLLDLERVRQRPVVPMRLRVKNLVQLHRTLGRLAGVRENLYFLHAYLGEAARIPGLRRRWRRAVCRGARRKDLQHALREARH